MWPPAKIMTMRTAPMASAGMTPAAAGITVQPTVRTRKKVPINSAIYFLILVFGLKDAFRRCAENSCIVMEWSGEAIFTIDKIWPSFDIPAFVVRSANGNECVQPTNPLINTVL